ncbi:MULTISPECIES: hypothetical protein [Dickeya]|nr:MULTISPECIES: hypothetical protein [Dickeya]MBO8134134.1 hypothetical protein [Dickeya fangzhongdai]UGA51895.1 hypothetical protein QR68_04435 [Dickeya fangzhongdai]UMB77755.1 hypothetical protein FXN80_04905 [Dickeya fangzhongdai]UWH08242.1 hypothetical protein K0H75_04440 [Dickeya fangzhongdai]
MNQKPVNELTDIPSDQVDEVVKDFESEGAVVEKIKQPNGLWTVKATFPH